MATQKPKKPKLRSQLQQNFVDELPNAHSATDAVINAGYDVHGDRNMAAVIASQNLRKPEIQAAVAEQRDAAKFAAVLSVVDRKERLSRLAHPDPEHPDPVAAIKELNRMESIGTSKVEHSGVVEIVFRGFMDKGVVVEGEAKELDATE